MIHLMIDAMGGDNAPRAIVEGCIAAINDLLDLRLTLFGKQEEIQPILDEAQYDTSRLAVVDAREVIDNNEAPVMAVRRKRTAAW